MIATAQAIALYVAGCCIVGLSGGCSAELWKSTAISVADCAATSALGCSMQMAGGCELPSVATDIGWGDYSQCLSFKAQSCATSSIARCTISGLLRVAEHPIVAGGSPCDQDAVELCVASATCDSERSCVENVAACYEGVCRR